MDIRNIKLSFAALLAGAALSTQVFAQAVSTPIVGFQKTAVPAGLSAAGFPLLNSDLVKTTSASVSGNAVSLSGQSNVGSLLTAGEPYYIEVYSGTLKGDRFDVNTSATISAANGTVVLDSASQNNTYPVASIATQLDNQTIALRKHVTVQQIQASASPAFTGNNNSALADQIQVFDSSGKRFVAYYLRSNGTEWRLTTGPTVVTRNPIPPGSGVMILRRGTTPTELTLSGSVRENDFSQPYVVGQQLLAPPVPVDYSPSSLGASATNAWTGNNNSTLADRISIYNPSSTSFVSYYLRSNGTEWRITTGPTVFTSNNIISSSLAYFVDRKSADANSVLINPIR